MHNDLWDRDLDNQVERTKSRPLASGALTVPQGIGELVTISLYTIMPWIIGYTISASSIGLIRVILHF